MSKQPTKLIIISYAKRALEAGSREQQRMLKYAEEFGEYHMIIFTKKSDQLPAFLQLGNLYLYGTNTYSRIGMLVAAYKIGRSIIRRSNQDAWIVSSQDPFETSLVGRALARFPGVYHHVQVHGDVFNPRSYTSSMLQQIRVIYGRYVVRRTSMIRVVSQRIADSLTALGVPDQVITVLPIQADLQSFLEVGDSRIYTPSQAVRFVYVGRLASEKNLTLLLTAFTAIAQKYPLAQLRLVGEGPEQERLQHRVMEHKLAKQVTFTNWTNDIVSVLKTSDVLCLTSNHEGWAMVLLEAAAAGMPVVTTDVGCAGECIQDGVHGTIVPVGDVEAYTQALALYCEQPQFIAQQGTVGNQFAHVQSLSADEYMKRFVESYTLRQEL